MAQRNYDGGDDEDPPDRSIHRSEQCKFKKAAGKSRFQRRRAFERMFL